MIIFGYRRMVKNLGFTTLVCQQCRNPVAQALRKTSSWFTLFFIPIFPYSGKHFLQCTFCGFTGRLGKEQAEGLLPYLQNPNAPQAAAPQGHQAAPAAQQHVQQRPYQPSYQQPPYDQQPPHQQQPPYQQRPPGQQWPRS